MTSTKHIVYRLCAQTVLLLMWYAVMSLLAAVKFLPVDPLASTLPYSQVNGLANVLLHLTLMTGLIAGGLYMVTHTIQTTSENRLLAWIWRGWTLFLCWRFWLDVLACWKDAQAQNSRSCSM